MKKVNKINMVRLVVTGKYFLYRAIEQYIKEGFLVESIGVDGIAYVLDTKKDYSLVVSSEYGCNLSQSYAGQSFVLELPEHLLNDKGIAASQDFEDKVSRKEIFTEIDYNGRVKFYGI